MIVLTQDSGLRKHSNDTEEQHVIIQIHICLNLFGGSGHVTKTTDSSCWSSESKLYLYEII